MTNPTEPLEKIAESAPSQPDEEKYRGYNLVLAYNTLLTIATAGAVVILTTLALNSKGCEVMGTEVQKYYKQVSQAIEEAYNK